MKIIYPAIFHKENNSYWVEFPDLVGCQSYGDTLEETLDGAVEALEVYSITLVEQRKPLNPPSDIESLKLGKDCFATLIAGNLLNKGKAVKKTLTIPDWLNECAMENSINFSKTLQKALIEQLHL